MNDVINTYQRAITYARVSGDDLGKDDRNLTGQLDMGREYALKWGYEIVAELAEDDRGASGASFELEQLGKLLEMAHNHEYDVLVVREIDRLSRNLAKQLIVEEELKRYGVRVEYILGEYADTPEGGLMKNIRATIAEYERLKIAERNTRGRRLKVQAGHVLTHGKAPLGYRLDKADGKEILKIYEPEAQIVRMIFSWYTEPEGDKHLTLFDIAARLTEMGMPTAKDSAERKWGSAKKRGYGEWGTGSVAKILKNPTYMGKWIYGKRAKINGKWETNPDEHLLNLDVPPLIDLETWEIAKERRIKNKAEAERNRINQYLVSVRAKCGICGLNVVGTTVLNRRKHYLYYRCNGTSHYGHKCSLPMFSARWLDEAMWIWAKTIITNPNVLSEGLQLQKEDREKQTAPLEERLKVVDDLLSDNREQLGRLLDLYLVGNFPKDILIERQKRLETNIHALERERAGLSATLEENSITDERIREIQDFAAGVAIGVNLAEADFTIRKQVIEALDPEITLTVEDGQKVAYFRWFPELQRLPYPPTPSLDLSTQNTISRGAPGRTRPRLYR